MQSEPSATELSAPPVDPALGRLVAKNALYLTMSQVLTIPMAVLVNAVLGRFLGPATFGVMYFAATLVGFGFLAVNWGHESALPALIARDRSQAGALLGSSLLWRLLASGVVYAVLAVGCWLLSYGAQVQWALALTFAINVFISMIAACKDTIRGFERTDIPAVIHVAQQFLTALLIVPALFLGGGMRVALAVQLPVAVLIFAVIWRSLRPVGVGALSVAGPQIKALAHMGTPFVFLGLATALQPVIDAFFLSRLAPPEVMGWYAVRGRLIGVLLFPASALVGALYPTLCRLHLDDKPAFARITRGALANVALVAVPMAVGCYLYPDIGVSLFSREAYHQAEGILAISAAFLFLVYFSMPLGTCIIAAGKQRAASVVQAGCVALSLVLDPWLIPYFQTRYGNGGLGVAWAVVFSEALVVVSFSALTPKGVFDRALAKTLLLSALCGGLMAGAGHLLRPVLSPFLSAPIVAIVYVVTAWVSGAIDKQQMDQLKGGVLRKFARFR